MTHKSRTDRHGVFKLGSNVGHVTRHEQQLFRVKRSKVKGLRYKVTRRVSRQKRYNSAVYGHIIFKLCGNYRRGDRRVWYTFLISRSNKPEVEIWRTFKILNAIINGKRRQIAEILHSNRKSGSRNRTAVSKFTPEVHK